MNQSNIEAQQQRALYALNCKHERERQIAAIVFPNRRTLEMKLLHDVIKAQHKLLVVMDEAEEPSDITDPTREMFGHYIAELTELCNPSPAK